MLQLYSTLQAYNHKMIINWIEYFQILSLSLSVIYNERLSTFKLSGLIPFLYINCLADFIGFNWSYFGWRNNYFLYNLLIILSSPIAYYLFGKMLFISGWVKYIFYTICTLVIIFFALNILFWQGTEQFNTYSFIIMEFVTVLLALLVLLKLFRDDDFSIMLYDHPYFWISGSSLLFGISMLVLLGLQQYIEDQRLKIYGVNIYIVITPILNILFYCSYGYACFLCFKVTHKSLSR